MRYYQGLLVLLNLVICVDIEKLEMLQIKFLAAETGKASLLPTRKKHDSIC